MHLEDETFASAGKRCAATWYWPANSDRNTPCVVLSNGFSGTKDWILPSFARRFVEAGVAAFAFDYRHLGESEGTPRQLVDVRGQRADLRAALAHVRGHSRVDPERVALWGTSLGGSHALTVAADDPHLAALILNMPALDAIAGGNAEAKRKRLGVSRMYTAVTIARLALAAVKDKLAAAFDMEPVYLQVYGRPGQAFLTDPELAPLFRAVAAGSATWQNRVAARFLLDPPRYAEGTFQRNKAPVLVCLAQHDLEVSASFIRDKAAGAAHVDFLTYPAGHFALYHGEMFEQVSADQAAFLRLHMT